MTTTSLPRPALLTLVAGVVVAGVLAVVNPVIGVAVAVVALVGVILVRVPLSRLGRLGVVVTAVAAIAGPNLGVPGAPSIFAFRVLIVLLGLGVVIYLMRGGDLVIPRGWTRPALLLGVMVAWSVISIAWADDVGAAVRWSVFLLMMSALAVAIPLACRDRRMTVRLLSVLGVTFLLATLLAVAELRLGFRLPTSALRSRDLAFATTSLFGNQNNFATYLTLTLPYFLCLPTAFRDGRLVVLGIVGSAITLVSLLFTGSRSNLVAAGLILTGLVIALATDGRRPNRVGWAAGLVAVGALIVIPSVLGRGFIPLPADAVTKFDLTLLLEQRRQASGSGAVREAVLTDGLGLVRDSGGLGVGAGNAEPSLRNLAAFSGVENLHNWWLEVLVNLGLVGLAAYVAMYLTLLRGQWRAAKSSDDPLVQWLGLSGALALVGFVIGSLGPSSVITFAPMWITFGLGMLTLVLARKAAA